MFAMVPGMSDPQKEPGDLTDRFQAFAKSADSATSRALPLALIAVGAVLLVVLIATIVVLSNA